MENDRKKEGLGALGHETPYRFDYTPEVLETFSNQHPDLDYWVRFNCPEFTTVCPITGQPDFAEIRISYIPDTVNTILKDLKALMDPKYIEVTGLFTPRGGISIYPYANYGRPGTRYEALAVQRFANHQ